MERATRSLGTPQKAARRAPGKRPHRPIRTAPATRIQERKPASTRGDGELHGGLVRLIFPDTASFGWMKHSPSCGASAAVRRPPGPPVRRRYRWSPDGAMLPRPRGGRGAHKRDTPVQPSECRADPTQATSLAASLQDLVALPTLTVSSHRPPRWMSTIGRCLRSLCRRRRTRICSSLASQVATQVAGQPRYQVCRFYVRSSSRNGINGRWPSTPIAAISVEIGGVGSGERQQEAHRAS